MFFRERNSPSLRNTSTSKAEGRSQQQQQRQTLSNNSRYGGSPTSYSMNTYDHRQQQQQYGSHATPIRSAHARQGHSAELTLLADVEYSEAVCRERIVNSLRLLRVKLKVLFAEGKDAAHRWEGIRGRVSKQGSSSVSSSLLNTKRTKEERLGETPPPVHVVEKVRMVLPSPNHTSPQSPPRALPPLNRSANINTSPKESRIVEQLSERAARGAIMRGRRDAEEKEEEESYNELLEGVRYLLAEDLVSDVMVQACRNVSVSPEPDNKNKNKDDSSPSPPLVKKRARAVELLRASANSGRKLGSPQEEDSTSRRDFSDNTGVGGDTSDAHDICKTQREGRLLTPFQRIRLRASAAIREKLGDDQVAELLASVDDRGLNSGGQSKGVGDHLQYVREEEEGLENSQRDPDIERIKRRPHTDKAEEPKGNNVSPSKDLRPKKSGNSVRRKQQRLQFLEAKSREYETESGDHEVEEDRSRQESVFIGRRREDVVLQKEPALSVSHTAQAQLSEEYWARQQAGSTARDRYMNDPLFLLSTSAKLAMFGHVYDSSSRLIKKASGTYVRAWGEHFDGVKRAMNAAREASPALKSEADRKRMLYEQDPDFAEKQRLKSAALASSPPRLLPRRARLIPSPSNSNLKPLYDDICRNEAKAEEVNEEKSRDEPLNGRNSSTFKQNRISGAEYSEGGQKALTLPPIRNNRGGHVAVTTSRQLASKRGKTKMNNSSPVSPPFSLLSLPQLSTVTSTPNGPPRYMAEYYVEEERRKAQQAERCERYKAYTFRLDERAWWMRRVREDALRAKLMREQTRTAEDDRVERSELSIKDRALLIAVEEKKGQQREIRELTSEEDRSREEGPGVRHTIVLHIPPPPPSQHADKEPAALE